MRTTYKLTFSDSQLFSSPDVTSSTKFILVYLTMKVPTGQLCFVTGIEFDSDIWDYLAGLTFFDWNGPHPRLILTKSERYINISGYEN